MAIPPACVAPPGFGRPDAVIPGFCRDCDSPAPAKLCPACGGARIVRHPQLHHLAIAHIDCDSFFASVEKHHRPELRDQPVIVGGGKRGVVSTCCYVARLYGVRSAMPMFKALELCPQAVVLAPAFEKYIAASRQIRALMEGLTPLVQPLSIDEAVLDLSGTTALHGASPAIIVNRLARRIEAEIGVTISIGLSHNRLLAKLAAERGKPRGFFVLGAEAPTLLARESVSLLPGVGPVQAGRLYGLGISLIGQLAALSERQARQALGSEGPSLVARARGEDGPWLHAGRMAKSVSVETTFEADLVTSEALEPELWQLCEKLGRRLREAGNAAGGIVLKLKTAGFAIRTRSLRLANATRLPESLFAHARSLLVRETDGTAFRLIGIGASHLTPAALADQGDLADLETPRRAARQAAIDSLRQRFGPQIVTRGIASRAGLFKPPTMK